MSAAPRGQWTRSFFVGIPHAEWLSTTQSDVVAIMSHMPNLRSLQFAAVPLPLGALNELISHNADALSTLKIEYSSDVCPAFSLFLKGLSYFPNLSVLHLRLLSDRPIPPHNDQTTPIIFSSLGDLYLEGAGDSAQLVDEFCGNEFPELRNVHLDLRYASGRAPNVAALLAPYPEPKHIKLSIYTLGDTSIILTPAFRAKHVDFTRVPPALYAPILVLATPFLTIPWSLARREVRTTTFLQGVIDAGRGLLHTIRVSELDWTYNIPHGAMGEMLSCALRLQKKGITLIDENNNALQMTKLGCSEDSNPFRHLSH